MNGDEAVKIFELARASGSLPTKLEELVPLSFIGSAAVKFYKAKVEAMRQLGVAEDQRKATLSDGQDAGECLLRIEARIGELAKAEPRGDTTPKRHRVPGDRDLPLKHEKIGIPYNRMKNAEAIHSHPEAVERVIKEARENEDIPTRTAVLKEIAYQKVKTQRDKFSRGEKQTINEALEKYIELLSQINLGLPEIIKNWDHIDNDQRSRFGRVALKFAEHVNKLGGKEKWNQSRLIAS